MLNLLVPLLLVLACALLTKRSQRNGIATFDRFAATRHLPVTLGTINALLVWWVFGFELNPIPQIQDEAAYLLQAGIFARGRWTEVAPPLPEFFTQMQVLTTPVLASKYPPGTSLFLTPFVALGAPVLGPMLLAGLTGGLLFALSRAVVNPSVATLAWVTWSTAPTALRWQATFLSQTLTATLWLGTLYLLFRYHRTNNDRLLIAIALAIGLCAITRPLTGVALAVPVGVAIVAQIRQSGRWRALLPAVLAGMAIVAILPLHNHMTTGDWQLSPLVKYARDYLPSDLPGFGLDSTVRAAPMPPDLEETRQELFRVRREHTVAALPRTLSHRIVRSLTIVAAGWRAGFILLIAVGAIMLPAAGRFGVALSLGLLLAYAVHAHHPEWSQYYLEAAPAYAVALAAGTWAVCAWVINGQRLSRAGMWSHPDSRPAIATIAVALLLVIPASVNMPGRVSVLQAERFHQRRLGQALKLAAQESPRSIVFIDYGERRNPHLSLVRNVPSLATAPVWIAHDRGADGLRLMRLAPERRGYIYRPDDGHLTRLPPLPELERSLAIR